MFLEKEGLHLLEHPDFITWPGVGLVRVCFFMDEGIFDQHHQSIYRIFLDVCNELRDSSE